MAEDEVLSKLSKMGDPLERLDKYMAWELFAPAIEGIFESDHSK